jgi:heme exporter protein A
MKLVAENLSGERAGQLIFAGIGFRLDEGEALVVTGANGSGKSTLLRVLAGLLPIASGSFALQDHQGDEENPRPAEYMHYMGHLNGLKPALSVGENLGFWQKYCPNPSASVETALEEVALAGIAHVPAAYLSTGQKRRVAIARLLVSHKPVWIVDEPTSGLDKASENLFAKLIEKHLSNGGIVVAATHQPLNLSNKVIKVTKSLNLDQLATQHAHSAEQPK